MGVMSDKITIAVSEEIKKQLTEIAERDDRNLSWVVRKALQEYIEKNNKE